MSFESIFGAPPGNQLFEVGTSRLPVTPAYLTWGDPVTDPPSALGYMGFDAILSEEHETGSLLTDHPVEVGTNIVDNIRPLPKHLVLDVFVSNSPINSPDATMTGITLMLPVPGQHSFLAGGTGGLLSAPPPSQASAVVDQFVGETNYVQAAYQQLEQLQSEGTLISVITPNVQYDNMILENVKLHRNPGTGTSGNFTLEFPEIVIVYSSIVAAPLPSKPSGETTVATGTQGTKPAPAQMTSIVKAHNNAAGVGGGAGSGVVQ